MNNIILIYNSKKNNLTKNIAINLSKDLNIKNINLEDETSNVILKTFNEHQYIIIVFNEFHGNLPTNILEMFYKLLKKDLIYNNYIIPVNVCGGTSGSGSLNGLFNVAQSLDFIIYPGTKFLNVHSEQFNFENDYNYALNRIKKLIKFKT